jgi:competence protein ComEA
MNQNEASPMVTIAAFAIFALTVIAGAVFIWLNQPVPVQITINPPAATATPAPTATAAPILVYVTGAVNNPQSTVSLPAGSRVQDAIEAAGGLRDDADLERVNLAGIVRDGDQIHVPSVGEATETVLPTEAGGGIVYINSATLEELMTLPGVGQATAQAILDYREANGRFESLEDLDNVEGIGPATLEELEPLLSFE